MPNSFATPFTKLVAFLFYKENGLLTRFFTKKKTGCSQRSLLAAAQTPA